MHDGRNPYLGKSYRFLTFDGLFKTIENRSLQFTRADKFNDPLDNSPYIAPIDWEMFSKQGDGSFQETAFESLLSRVFKPLFICCFCKEYKSDDSYLMWSHYGKSHSQVCFEIDFSKYKSLGEPSEVDYPENLLEKRNRAIILGKAKRGRYLVTTKLRQWSYEKEVRLVVDTKSPDTDLEKFKFSDNSEHLYMDFDLKSISKVVFGINSELVNELKTRDLFLRQGLKPEFEKMYINPETLELESKVYDFE